MALFLALAMPARADGIKLSTWNLNWLTTRPLGDASLPADVHPRSAADFDRLRAYANRLNADVVAFQEVDGATAAARVFDPARYTILTIGQDVVQQVGLAVRHGIAVRRNSEVTALDVEPPGAAHRLRDGLDATLTFPPSPAHPVGTILRVLVVHLKSGCQRQRLPPGRNRSCSLLAAQVPPLAAWAGARAAEGAAFALMGDFNRVLDQASGESGAAAPDAMQAALDAAAPVLRVTAGQANPCWAGDAFIDHILLGGPARAWLVPGSLRVLRYDERDEADKARLSDHCPVSVRIAPERPG